MNPTTTPMSNSEEPKLPAFSLPVSAARPRSQGVRILAPGGDVGYVPAELLDQALAAGATLLPPDKMREMRQAIFMEHNLFESKKAKPRAPRHKRKGLWKGGK